MDLKEQMLKGIRMKQITVYKFLDRNKDILCGYYVAMDKTGNWKLYGSEPEVNKWFDEWILHSDTVFDLSGFSIAPFDGDWKDSLIKIADYQKDKNKLADSNSENRVYKKEAE